MQSVKELTKGQEWNDRQTFIHLPREERGQMLKKRHWPRGVGKWIFYWV